MIDVEALAVELLKSEHFAEYLAEAVSREYSPKLMEEFGGEVARAMDKAVKEAVAEYIDAFEVQGDIKHIVNQAITGITKKELLEKL